MATSAELRAVLDEAVAVSNLGSRTWCGQTYNNVFKGETLLNVLLKDPLKYPSRGEALQYGQELLDTQAITCITKRRTFEDGDRLYSVSQSVLGKNDRVFLGKVAKKSPSTKTATQKETVSKQNSPERTNLFNGHQQDKSIAGKEEGLNGGPSGLRSSPHLLRLLKKDETQGKVAPSGTNMALSENSTVKMGLGSVSVVLKDKQPEVRKDENLVTEKINAIPSTLNSEQKAQGLPYTTTHASKSVTSRPVEAFSLKVEENGHLPLSSRTGDVGDGRQSCLFDSKTSNDSKRPCSDNDSASMESKQRLHRTLSPALAALIERDAKNSQTYSKNEVGKRETCGKVSEDSSAPVLGVACTKKDEPLNSWDAFELKLQNKILKSTDKRLLGSDARGRHEGTFASKHEENEKISFRGISSADLEKDKLEGKLSPGKHEPTSNDENYEDKRNSKKKVGVQNEVLTPSITARTRSFLGLKESEKPEEKNTEMKSTLGKEDSTGRETIHSFSSRDGSKNVVFEEVGAVNNLHLDKGLNTTENFTSFSLGSDSLAVVVDKGDSNKKSLSDKEVSIGKQHSDTNQRITSFSLTADPKNSAVEDGTFENSSSSTKDDSDTRQRVSSFSLRGDSETRIVDNAARKINQTTSGTKNLAQEKGSNCIPERPPCDKTLDSSIQEDLVQVDGHTIPKTLAVLLARDGTSPEKKEEGSENDDCNVFKNKLKELKKTGPRSGVSLVVTCPKNGAQSNVELPQSTSDGKVDDVSYNKVIYRLKNDHEEVEKDTAHDNEGCTEKLPSNSPLSKPSVIEDDISSSQRSKAIAEEKNTGRDFSGNAKKRTVDDVSVSIRIPGNKPLMSQGNSPESSSMDYTVPRLNHKPDSSYNSVSMPTVASRTGLPSQPHSLGISPTSKSSPIASDAVSPSQLRKELEKSRKDLEESKRTYENKITELQLQIDFLRRQKSGQIDVNGNFLESSASISDLTSLYSSFSTPVVSPGNSNVTSPSPTPCVTPRESTPDEYVAFSPRSPPPPPPAPPSVPSLPTANGSHVKPTKPVVNPRTDMKPLFWNRIITSNDSDRRGKSVWKTIKEPTIDALEFERFFSKKTTDRKLKRTKSLRDDKHFAHIKGKKVAKLLNADRSRAIGIKMSSLNCQLEDIRNAVYNMDTSVVDMESLQFIYDIYPKEEEIQLIQEHVRKLPSVPLDKPEEFMYQLTKMRHIKERLECWLFQDKFSESIFGIDRSLACVTESCTAVTTNAEVAAVLSLVLAYGNYMNGNTIRGQADGFQLGVLLKLRDIKNKESDLNLLQYIVKHYMKQHERGTEKGRSDFKLPSSVSLSNAAQVSFDKLREELNKVSLLLKETELQVKKILDECSPAERNPFEEQMRLFQAMAQQNISEENVKMEKAQQAFRETVEYFQWEPEGKKETLQEFFGLWAKFIEEVKTCVKLEKQQHLIAKKNISKVEHLNQIKEAATKFKKRRQSVELI